MVWKFLKSRLFTRRVTPLTNVIMLLLFSTQAGAQSPKVVDQILALVNDEAITRSDLLWSLALDPKAPSPAGPVSPDLFRQKLDVMIDERLVLQEASRIPARITREEINRKRTELIKEFPSEAAFRERVEAVGLTPERINQLLEQRVLIDRFVDFRFRSFVLVTDQEIQRYYDEKFAPEIRNRGAVPPPLDAELPSKVTVRDDIRNILKEEKINQEIDRYLTAARQRADIVQLAEP